MTVKNIKGVSIILMKGYDGKSRIKLDPSIKKRLVRALVSDIYKTVIESQNSNSWECVIATPNIDLSNFCKKNNMKILDLEKGELNSIFHQIQNWVVKSNYDAFILFAGDIPLVQKSLIDKIKDILYDDVKTKRRSLIICPSKKKGISILAMAPSNLVRIREQKGTANLKLFKRKMGDGFHYTTIADIGSYLDIDQPEDLCEVLMLMERNPTYNESGVKVVLREIVTKNLNKT